MQLPLPTSPTLPGDHAADAPHRLVGVHGGPDALGVPAHDFSTNSNACGPCPAVLAALQQADATRYPDPAYTALRAALAALHGVAPGRIVVAGSASEFIHRITTWAQLQGAAQVLLPPHSYGDYAQAAQAHRLAVRRRGAGGADGADGVYGVHVASTTLQWACEPASPLGTVDAALAAWHAAPLPGGVRVLDCAYHPLRLEPAGPAPALPASAWQLWSPNKALGLTGVRAAYAVAPAGAEGMVLALQGLAASWPVGAHGVALLHAWATPAVQQWVAACLPTLRQWKARQQALCTALGWAVLPGSLANYFVATLPGPSVSTAETVFGDDLPAPHPPVRAAPVEARARSGAAHLCGPGVAHPATSALQAALRQHGIKLRDCTSFGLPGAVRLGVLPPASQDALQAAWHAVQADPTLRT
ncbi:aminotransferase class I/II-fold pyridoxal phosphate-dependent enzyme [Acidovorax sp. 106]|uniref:aminotransferase class I/II-fold pyridoxal phosphate-dependent enzyme n=1 Tax=Acidovorax sp. 106 TaxID=2135637 RepID=UPI000EAD1F4A|nr:aminotransferase class I/II-fold pyridoxal phosphate-dependent enzyme [Acidovorax sp. 106]RLJ40409.1 histidinol-phosphate aminotransferase [Acidovorax sp. 106]